MLSVCKLALLSARYSIQPQSVKSTWWGKATVCGWRQALDGTSNNFAICQQKKERKKGSSCERVLIDRPSKNALSVVDQP
jgi:hypothetical protein